MKFKGAKVEVTIENNNTIDANAMRQMSQDGAVIQSLLRKHGAAGFDNGVRQNLRTARNAAREIVYKVRVSMTRDGKEYVKSKRWYRSQWGSDLAFQRTIRQGIKDMRRGILDEIRDSVTRYDRKIESHMSTAGFLNTARNSLNLYVAGRRDVGFVNSRPNQILEVYERRLARVMFDEIRPKSEERHVGIEIECGIKCSKEQLGVMLRPFKGFVMIKHDGSVRVPDRNAVELNICAPITEYKRILKGVTDVLNSPTVDARVNKTCGLHVHLDVRGLNIGEIEDKYAKLVSVQGILYSMQPQSRQTSIFCTKNKSRTLVRKSYRYDGINGQAVFKYKTIETRIHAGTTDFTKISNWIDILSMVMYSSAVTPKRGLSRPDSMFRLFGLPVYLAEYVVGRIRQFQAVSVEDADQASVSA